MTECCQVGMASEASLVCPAAQSRTTFSHGWGREASTCLSPRCSLQPGEDPAWWEIVGGCTEDDLHFLLS